MRCFLACFGFTKKRRRAKCCNTVISPNQRHGRYVPLDFDNDISAELDITQKTSDSEHIDKPKESASFKIKKKVSFNLNVKTYEPLQNDEIDTYFSAVEEETEWEFNEEETQRATVLDIHREQATMLSRSLSYPTDYRYGNCRDSYDEEDEITLDDGYEDDFDDEEIYDSNDDVEEDPNVNQVESPMFNSAYLGSDRTVVTVQVGEERMNDLLLSRALPDEELNGVESNRTVRHRSQYLCSVLNPVENLTHWKAVKARTRMQLRHQQENIMLMPENELSFHAKTNSFHVPRNSEPQENRNAVDSSLSNWLFPSDKEPVAKV